MNKALIFLILQAKELLKTSTDKNYVKHK